MCAAVLGRPLSWMTFSPMMRLLQPLRYICIHYGTEFSVVFPASRLLFSLFEEIWQHFLTFVNCLCVPRVYA